MVRAPPLGSLLVDTGVLTQAQLEEVLVIQRTDRRRLGELLVERSLVHPLALAQLLSHQLSCPWISLTYLDLAPEVVAILRQELAVEHGLVPVHLRISNGQRVLYVATDDPTDDVALAACATAVGMPVRPMVALRGEVRAALSRVYATAPTAGDGVPSAAEPVSAEPPTKPQPQQGPKPPPRKPTEKPPPVPTIVHEEVVELAPPTKLAETRAPTVLALNAPEGFLTQCRAAATAHGATLIDGAIMRAGDLVAEHRPCAIIVTDDVYAFDRSGLNRLALENDAHLVVWSEDVDGRQLGPLLAGAIDRWGRSSYEKGTIVDGRYELLRDLGEETTSAGASLWEVRNIRTARRSILALAVRGESDENAVSIRREQKALARMTHAGAVELRDAGTTELGDPYIVLEPLDGRTLDGLVSARTKLATVEACAVMIQVAAVLSAAHAVGVVHRQVVPDTIVVARDPYGVERVKLIGWGKALVGEAASVDAREDVIALASCAFEALTGRRPKAGEDVAGAGLPDALASVIARALATSDTTLASAKELAQAFLRVAPKARERTQLLEASPKSRDSLLGLPAVAGPPEQRRFQRAPYRTPVRIEVPGIGAHDGRSEDISAGGLLVVSRGGLKAGTDVTIRFALPLDGRVVAETATVKWSRAARADDTSGLCAIGIALTAASVESLRQIERYVSFMGEGSAGGRTK